jgi:hypothetical protein
MIIYDVRYFASSRAVFALLTALLCLLLIPGTCNGVPPSLPALSGILPITAPRITSAGEQIEISIGPVSAANGTPVGLVMIGARGPHIYNTTFEAGWAQIVIPASDTYQSGLLSLVAAADDARGNLSIVVYPPESSPDYHVALPDDSRASLNSHVPFNHSAV